MSPNKLHKEMSPKGPILMPQHNLSHFNHVLPLSTNFYDKGDLVLYWDQCIPNLDYDPHLVLYGPHIIDSVVGYGLYHLDTLNKEVMPLPVTKESSQTTLPPSLISP